MKKVAVISLLTILIASLFITSPAAATSPPDCVSVIIVFKDTVSAQDVNYLTALGGAIKYTYTIIDGVAAELPAAAASKLKSLQNSPAAAADPLASRIKYIEDDITMHALSTEGGPAGQSGIAALAGAEKPAGAMVMSVPDAK
ncbi:MAG TPA: hypothetical protein VGJ92_07680 [Methanocella sp.]